MDWNNCRDLDQICYSLVLGDYPRGLNRARIDKIANGEPPYTAQEAEDNNIEVNISDLTHTRLMHDGRAQMNNGFLKTGNFFSCKTDMGPRHKRNEYSAIVTREVNRPMKRSIPYFEAMRAKFGTLILHGISPAVWETEDCWCTTPIGIEDVLIPGKTLLGFKNLPFYVLRRSFTGIELKKLATGNFVDPGWNSKLVNRCLEWIDSNTSQLMGSNWPDVWMPEKVEENVKEQSGFYPVDNAPTINCFDIYAYVDEGPEPGWIRRIILDSWSTPTLAGAGTYNMSRKADYPGKNDKFDPRDDFLYTSRDRKVGSTWNNMISFQFADLSAVFPARYHSIRSLGWLVFASCHLGMRLRCKFYESVLEALMPFYKVKSMDDAQRALKLDLVNRGFIDDTITPVPAAERWQVNSNLVELGLKDNQQVTSENSASFTQNQNYSRDRTEKTKFQVMAEMNATTSLVSAALNQAYQYQTFEDREIFRRFMRPKSNDIDVLKARAAILRQGVPEELLEPEHWDIEHERVMGGGNKTMEMTIASWLMEQREKFDPEPQRVILHDAVLAISDNPGLADELVPEKAVHVSDSMMLAASYAASLLDGLQVPIKTGINHIEVVETLLGTMQQVIQRIQQSGGVGEPKELMGLQNMAAHIQQHIQIIGQDEQEAPRAKQYADVLAKMMNMVKAFAQRLQEQMKKQAEERQKANGQGDPKDAAKAQAMMLQAQVKAKNSQQSHAQKTAQRQIQFEQKLHQDQQQHRADIAKTDLEAASNINRSRLSSTEE